MRKIFGSLELLNDSIGTQEAINFQPNSQFPKELVRLFQQVFDKVKQYEEEHTTKSADEIFQKHKYLKDVIEKEVGTDLLKCIEKYTGFKVREITSCLPENLNSTFDVHVQIHNTTESFEELCETISASSGYGKPSTSIGESKIIKEITDINRSLDKVKGTISRGSKWNVTINIPVGLFVVKDILNLKADECQMSAENMAAVLLHEIGHIFAWVECLGDIAYMCYYGNNILRDINAAFDTNPSVAIDDSVKFINDALPNVKNAAHLKLFQNATKILNRIKMKIEDTTDEERSGTYKFNVLKFVASQIVTIVIGIIVLSTVIIFPRQPIQELFRLMALPSNELSHDYVTEKNTNMFERLADEFVSRYGMSKALNDGLIRLHKLIRNVQLSGYSIPIYNKTIRDFMVIRALVFLTAMPFNIYNYLARIKNDGLISGYEHDYTRLYRNINNMHDLLKNNKLDRKIRDELLHDIEEMTDQLKRVKHKVTLNLLEKILKFILSFGDNIISGTRYIFGSAHADKDFLNLFEHLDDLLSNKSYYYSAKFTQLLNGK